MVDGHRADRRPTTTSPHRGSVGLRSGWGCRATDGTRSPGLAPLDRRTIAGVKADDGSDRDVELRQREHWTRVRERAARDRLRAAEVRDRAEVRRRNLEGRVVDADALVEQALIDREMSSTLRDLARGNVTLGAGASGRQDDQHGSGAQGS